MKTVAAVLFDLDGTLIDSVDTIITATRQTCEAMLLDCDETAVRNMIGIPLLIQASLIAGDRKEEFFQRYRTIYRGFPDAVLYSGARETLEWFRAGGLRLGVVTSKQRRGTFRALESIGLDDILDVVVTADDVTRFKPDPEPIRVALGKLRLTAEQVVYVGDSVQDIECARNAGVKMASVTWGARCHKDLLSAHPDVVVDTWADLEVWLNTQETEMSNLITGINITTVHREVVDNIA